MVLYFISVRHKNIEKRFRHCIKTTIKGQIDLSLLDLWLRKFYIETSLAIQAIILFSTHGNAYRDIGRRFMGWIIKAFMSSFILRKYFEEYVTKLLSFCQYFFYQWIQCTLRKIRWCKLRWTSHIHLKKITKQDIHDSWTGVVHNNVPCSRPYNFLHYIPKRVFITIAMSMKKTFLHARSFCWVCSWKRFWYNWSGPHTTIITDQFFL